MEDEDNFFSLQLQNLSAPLSSKITDRTDDVETCSVLLELSILLHLQT